MAGSRLNHLWQQLRGLVRPPSDTGETDRQLLERFVVQRDEAAFTALVERHGAMVRNVCRRVLDDAAAADDAFQAAFLVLACKADSVSWHESLAGWLWATAYRVASKAKVAALRRQRHERKAALLMAERPASRDPDPEVRKVLDEELGRLPEKYRLPLVLCYLEGRTTDEAAAELSWPRGTVAGRLARGRDLLRDRLSRRGLALSAGALTLAMTEQASAAVPAPMILSTAHAAVLFALGERTTAAGVSGSVVALVQGVLTSMWYAKLKLLVVICASVVLVGLGAGWAVHQSAVAHSPDTLAAGVAPLPDNAPPGANAQQKGEPSVRKLTIKPDLGRLPGGEFKVEVFTDAASASKAAGDAVGKQLAAQVDFTKEHVVHVQWSTSGPPEGILMHEIKKGEPAEVVFYVQGPKANVRGQRLRLGSDFFAVTPKVKVSIDKRERPGK